MYTALSIPRLGSIMPLNVSRRTATSTFRIARDSSMPAFRPIPTCSPSIVRSTRAVVLYVYDICAGDLHSIIKTGAFFCDDELIKRVFIQIVDTLEYYHKRVYHRDLKPENILVSALSGDIDVFVADFGLATTNKLSASTCGTPCFMSPGMYLSAFFSPSPLAKNPYSRITGTESRYLLYRPRRRLGTRLHPCRDDRQRTTLVASYSRGQRLQRLLVEPLRALRQAPRLTCRVPAPPQIFLHQVGLRPSLTAIRSEVVAMDTFFLSDEEAIGCG